jgi:hypothetical protein
MTSSAATKGKTASTTSSRRSKKSQEVNLGNTATVERPATQEETSQTMDKGAQVIAMPQLTLKETPQEETTQSSSLPGNRPISSRDLKFSQVMSIMGNRPVDVSNIQVLGTISAMGERPIFASSFEVIDTITVSGDRPISKSNLVISETGMIMGNRPIAPNYLDDEADLMGYLD